MRYALAGITAGIADNHVAAIAGTGGEVVGAWARDPVRGSARAAALGCPFFAEIDAMLTAVRPDVAVILTPHPTHAAIARQCLAAGAHVLIEKPIAARVAEADAVLAAAARARRLVAVSFQQRTAGAPRTLKKLLESGGLGRIQHIELTGLWPRSAAYYAAKPWRGTWAGEGGGVLMNQGAHNLDLLVHLMGLPESVFAWTRTDLHAIEAEDTAHAALRWADGATGSLLISTAQAPARQRLEIRGTRGTALLRDGVLNVERLPEDVADILRDAAEPMPKPLPVPEILPPEPGSGRHDEIYANLEAAVTRGVPLLVDGAEAARSLELANAIVLSAHVGGAVRLPLDRRAYEALFARLVIGAGGGAG